MAHFSIRQAVHYSFSTCRKHFLSLLAVSAVMAAGVALCTFGPDYAAYRLELPDMQKVGDIIRRQGELGQEQAHTALRAVMDQISVSHVIALLLTYLLAYLLYSYLCVGFARLFLHLKDTGRVEPSILFGSSLQQVLCLLAALAFIVIRIIGIVAVLAGVLFLLTTAQLGGTWQAVAGLLLPALVVGMVLALCYYNFPYMFLMFAVADESHQGVWAALRACESRAQGFRLKLLGVLGALMLLVIIPVICLVVPVMIGALNFGLGATASSYLGQALCLLVVYPPSFALLAFLYRALEKNNQ